MARLSTMKRFELFKRSPVVFETHADEPVNSGRANRGGLCGCVGRGFRVDVLASARNARTHAQTVVLQEHALRAESKESTLVGVFGLEAGLVFSRGLFLGILDIDIFGIKTVLESEEGKQVQIEPFERFVCPGEHYVQADFVLGEIPMVQFLVDFVALVNFDVVV